MNESIFSKLNSINVNDKTEKKRNINGQFIEIHGDRKNRAKLYRVW